MDGPTHTQLVHLGELLKNFHIRVINELEEIQRGGPTRVSGMIQEVDFALKKAVCNWAEEIRK